MRTSIVDLGCLILQPALWLHGLLVRDVSGCILVPVVRL